MQEDEADLARRVEWMAYLRQTRRLRGEVYEYVEPFVWQQLRESLDKIERRERVRI